VKELLEKIGAGDLFAHLCPGTLLLCSVLIWGGTGALHGLPEKEGWQGLTVAAFLLILAYTVGLIVSAWSSEGTARYVREAGREYPHGQVGARVRLHLLRLFHWFPRPYVNPSIVENNLQIAEDLDHFVGLQGLSSLEVSWERFTIYRAVIADQLGDKGKLPLAEAEAIHRRFLFSQGVALACLLLAVQLFARWLLGPLLWPSHIEDSASGTLYIVGETWHSTSAVVLVILGFLAVMASVALRWAAGRWWETEVLLTCSLSKLLAQTQAAADAGATTPPAAQTGDRVGAGPPEAHAS
jgi:hypothetical protein